MQHNILSSNWRNPISNNKSNPVLVQLKARFGALKDGPVSSFAERAKWLQHLGFHRVWALHSPLCRHATLFFQLIIFALVSNLIPTESNINKCKAHHVKNKVWDLFPGDHSTHSMGSGDAITLCSWNAAWHHSQVGLYILLNGVLRQLHRIPLFSDFCSPFHLLWTVQGKNWRKISPCQETQHVSPCQLPWLECYH